MISTLLLRGLAISSALALAFFALPRNAHAADPLAESLYQEGRRATEAKDWELACKKYRESYDHEPAPGTLLNLADCEEKRGLLTDALAHFEAASRLFRDERGPFAKERAGGIERRLPRLTLRLEPTAPRDTTVERDGRPVDAASLGAAIPLDPGEHVLLVHASGRADVRRSIRLSEGEKRDVELVPGAPLPSGAAPSPRKLTAAPASPREPGGGTQRALGIGALGLGAVGLGVGIVGGIMVLNAKSTADASCSPGCNPAGLEAESRGKTMSVLSTAGFATAGVGLAVGATLMWLVPASSSRASAAVTVAPMPGGSVVGWTGTF